MSNRPNIILIMADELNPLLTHVYGDKASKTPALDRLYEEGVRFDSAYTNFPLCTPARAAMMTGRYASRTRTYDNASMFPADIPTFAHCLRANGYEVVATGKLHSIGPDQLHGFESRLTTDIYPSSLAWLTDWEQYEKNGIKLNTPSYLKNIGIKESSLQMNYDEETHFRALEYLRNKSISNDENPFLLFVSYTQPHNPYIVPSKYWDMIKDEDIELPLMHKVDKENINILDKWVMSFSGIPDDVADDIEMLKKIRHAYYGMISYIDEKVSELVGTLEQLQMRDDTIIIFTSDHGDYAGERQCIDKRSFYESSSRIPLIISYPKEFGKHLIQHTPVSLIDFLPTLCELTGSEMPENIDGQSFASLINDVHDESRIVIGESLGEAVMSPCFMVRKENYKYIYIHGFDELLFDLEKDPKEINDLAKNQEFLPIVKEMKEELFKRVDPEKIREDIVISQKELKIIRNALQKGKPTTWDYYPYFDASKMYVRKQ